MPLRGSWSLALRHVGPGLLRCDVIPKALNGYDAASGNKPLLPDISNSLRVSDVMFLFG
jgi:hypothetical protein